MRKKADFDRRGSQNVRRIKQSEILKMRRGILCVIMLGCLTSETITTFIDITTDYKERFVLGKVEYNSRIEVELIKNLSRKVDITITLAG